MVKWHTQEEIPSKSRNIVIRLNKSSIHYCGDYTYNKSDEEEPLDWKKFTSHILLLNHCPFEWCYWDDVEKILNKESK